MIRKILKRKYLFIGIGLISFFILFLVFYLIYTDDYSNARFRTMQGTVSTRKKVDLTGLRDLKASGGPIINFSKLRKKLIMLVARSLLLMGCPKNMVISATFLQLFLAIITKVLTCYFLSDALFLRVLLKFFLSTLLLKLSLLKIFILIISIFKLKANSLLLINA